MNINDYRQHLEVWLSGLKDEIDFWDYYMRNEGGISFYGFEKTVSSNRKFELEDDIPVGAYGKEYKFIDVGSGPFSRCGMVTDKVTLDAVSVDPLAYAYSDLKKKYGLDNGVRLENGFVELLNMKYGANVFDMVHMSNSLDHCFSALDGIYQLLNICKIGGKVILRHGENEAANAKYTGLHQWNLSLHNKEKSFVIWRENERHDVCKMFADIADIELIPDVKEKEGHWTYNKVIFTKKKDVNLPVDNEHYKVMLDSFYRALINELMQKSTFYSETANDESIAQKRVNRIRKAWHRKDMSKKILENEKLSSFIIYGMGFVGNNLDYLLDSCGINATKLDIKGKNSMCFSALTMEQCNDYDVDMVVMTIDNEDVRAQLSSIIGEKTKLVTIDEFLDLLEERK